jgi:hypothetical protein
MPNGAGGDGAGQPGGGGGAIGGGQPAAGVIVGRNIWDFATAGLVLAFLTLIVWIVLHYAGASDKGATILGVLMPVFGAVFGVSIGYWTGNQSGQAQGAQNTRQNLKQGLGDTTNSLSRHVETVVNEIRTQASSPPGQDQFIVPPNAPLRVNAAELDALHKEVGVLEGYVKAL